MKSLPCVLALAFAATPAAAQLTVHDPANYAQNLLQAARSLETINNQVASLQNEARNLVGQPYSSLARLKAQIQRTQSLLGEARRVAFDVRAIDQAFSAGAYGPAPTGDSAILVERARSRWADEVSALRDSLRLQAQAVSGVGLSGEEAARLLAASQSAEGALSAAQAGNQLLALQARQLSELTAMLAAQGRAEALKDAARAAERAEAEQRLRRFLGKEPRP